MPRHRFHTATLADLRDLIEDMIQEHGEQAQAAFASDYGDHGNTQQVHLLEGEAEARPIVESAYSFSGFALASEEEIEEDDREEEVVGSLVIIR